MHSGSRPKKTTLMNAAGGDNINDKSSVALDSSPLELMCDNSHTHKPWGMLRKGDVFATAEERRYPPLLCSRLATAFAKVAKRSRKRFLPVSKAYVAANRQPRRGEAHLSQTSPGDEEDLVPGNLVGPPATLDSEGIPTGPIRENDTITPSQFLDTAKKLTHPFDLPVKLPPSVAKTLCRVAALGPAGIKEHREVSLDCYKRRMEHLEVPEAELHAKLDAGVEELVGNKQVLLFREMLKDIGYDDLAVADLLVTGIKLIGTLPRLGIWRPDERRAEITVAAALYNSPDAKKSLNCAKSKPLVRARSGLGSLHIQGGRRRTPSRSIHRI